MNMGLSANCAHECGVRQVSTHGEVMEITLKSLWSRSKLAKYPRNTNLNIEARNWGSTDTYLTKGLWRCANGGKENKRQWGAAESHASDISINLVV